MVIHDCGVRNELRSFAALGLAPVSAPELPGRKSSTIHSLAPELYMNFCATCFDDQYILRDMPDRPGDARPSSASSRLAARHTIHSATEMDDYDETSQRGRFPSP